MMAFHDFHVPESMFNIYIYVYKTFITQPLAEICKGHNSYSFKIPLYNNGRKTWVPFSSNSEKDFTQKEGMDKGSQLILITLTAIYKAS